MLKTGFAIGGILTALLLWKTSDDWLPQLQQFIQNDIQPPKFEGVKEATIRNGLLNFTAILSFIHNSILPVKVDNLVARVSRLTNGKWSLLGQTRPEDQQSITLNPKAETKFDIPLSVNIGNALSDILNSIFNFGSPAEKATSAAARFPSAKAISPSRK